MRNADRLRSILNYLEDQTKGMEPEDRIRVHYRIVGAACFHMDDQTFRSVVDASVSVVKASSPGAIR